MGVAKWVVALSSIGITPRPGGNLRDPLQIQAWRSDSDCQTSAISTTRKGIGYGVRNHSYKVAALSASILTVRRGVTVLRN